MNLQPYLSNIFTKAEAKIAATCARIGDMIPYIPDPETGHYTDTNYLSWWVNGFWSGVLWQMHHATGKEIYRTTAAANEERLDQTFHNFVGLHHDVGFMFLHTAVANFRQTRNEQSRKRGLHAANILAGRYNPSADFIIAWDYDAKGWMIVDTMMNLPILYWAAQ